MTLETWLFENKIKPSAFAARIGVAPSTITRLIKGERSPRLDLIASIQRETNGQVTLADFLPTASPEAA